MKKIIALLMAVTLCVSMTGCGKKNETTTTSTTVTATNGKTVEKDLPGGGKVSVSVGGGTTSDNNIEKYDKCKTDVKDGMVSMPGADINIKSYAIFDGKDNSKVLAIAADYTNKDDKDSNFSIYDIFMKCYQNGVGLEKAYPSVNPAAVQKDWDTSIKPGSTIEVMFSLELRNDKEDVELVFSDYSKSDSNPDTASYTLKISK